MRTRSFTIVLVGGLLIASALLAAGAALHARWLEIAGVGALLVVGLARLSWSYRGRERDLIPWLVLILAVIVLAFVAQRIAG